MENIDISFYNSLKGTYKNLNNKLSTLFSDYNLTVAQFFVLKELYLIQPLSIQEIIDKLDDSSGNMTVVIRNLEKNGFILRRTNTLDERSSLISLTSKGKSTYLELIYKYNKLLSDSFKSINKKDKQVMNMLLSRIK